MEQLLAKVCIISLLLYGRLIFTCYTPEIRRVRDVQWSLFLFLLNFCGCTMQAFVHQLNTILLVYNYKVLDIVI